MKNFLIAIIFFEFIGFIPVGYAQPMDPALFLPSSLVSRETSYKQLGKIYLSAGKFRTFHCGCVFDKLKQVFPSLCERGEELANQNLQSTKLQWVSMMPAAVFGGSLKCWNKPLCSRPGGNKIQGQQCCSEVSPKFKKMESDMHNIFPVVEKLASTNESSDFGGMWEYQFCPMEGLADKIKGDVARAYFYMSYQYKISLREDLQDALRTWHFEDPPDEWEKKRNDMIEVIQGNRNPFIDQPEWVERVRDF